MLQREWSSLGCICFIVRARAYRIFLTSCVSLALGWIWLYPTHWPPYYSNNRLKTTLYPVADFNNFYYVSFRGFSIHDITIMEEEHEILRRRGEPAGSVSASEVAAGAREERKEDSEWETDEEGEQLLQVELSGIFQDDLTKNPNRAAKFIGLDTRQPIVQLGDQVFAGKYKETVGMSVFFKVNEYSGEIVDDPVFSKRPNESLEYHSQTGRKLTLKRVFLNEKKK